MKYSHGWGPFKWRWYSICSAHSPIGEDEIVLDCHLCQKGRWINAWSEMNGHFLYKFFPKVWIWLANR